MGVAIGILWVAVGSVQGADHEPGQTNGVPAATNGAVRPAPTAGALRGLFLAERASADAGPRHVALPRPAGEEIAPGAWRIRAELGLNTQSGNTDAESYHVSLFADRARDDHRLEAEAGLRYGEQDGQRSADNAQARVQYRQNLAAPWFTALEAKAQRDAMADLDYRVVGIWSVGLDLVRKEATVISLDAGPAYVAERKAGVDDEFPGAKIGELLEQRLNDHVLIWQRGELLPSLEDTSVYLAFLEAGVETALSARLRFRASIQDRYDSAPAADKEANDLATFLSLAAEW
jgi:putative salt-induced outer membrane protein YdiY